MKEGLQIGSRAVHAGQGTNITRLQSHSYNNSISKNPILTQELLFLASLYPLHLLNPAPALLKM